MEARKITRDELFAMAGITNVTDDYTPVSVGNKNKLGSTNFVWGNSLTYLTFVDVPTLREVKTQNVHKEPLYRLINGVPVASTFDVAIVEDGSNIHVATHSPRYVPTQNSIIVEGVANACEDTDLAVFGNLNEQKGRMYGFANFSNPDIHPVIGDMYDDPFMLGVTFKNSHHGDSAFTGEFYGIRKVCNNMLPVGNIIGKCRIPHIKDAETVTNELSKMLNGLFNKIEAFKDKLHIAKETPLTREEQTALLWGVELSPMQIENILTYRDSLEPTIGEKPSAYSLMNTITAYTTWKTGSSHTMEMNRNLGHRAEKLLTENIEALIDNGIKVRTRYLEELNKPKNIIDLKLGVIA